MALRVPGVDVHELEQIRRRRPDAATTDTRQHPAFGPARLGGMSDIRIVPIDPDRLDAMRRQGADEHGNPWQHWVAQGWEPLRCCLRGATAGEDIALISYSPWTQPSPWAEAGPVFVHFGRCAGYDRPGEYPEALRGSRKVLRPYDHTGALAYDRIRIVAPDEDPEAAVRSILDHPDLAFVHVRSASAGCLTFEVRPVR